MKEMDTSGIAACLKLANRKDSLWVCAFGRLLTGKPIDTKGVILELVECEKIKEDQKMQKQEV